MRRSESKLEHQKRSEKNKFYGEREGNYFYGNNNKTAKNNCITHTHTGYRGSVVCIIIFVEVK